MIRVQVISGTPADLSDQVQGLRYSNSNPGGDEVCSFSLKRQWFSGAPEISQGNVLRVSDGLDVLWQGRIEESDRAVADSELIGVTAYGLGVRLKDDQHFERCYVHAQTSEWSDVRGFSDTDISISTPGWGVQAADRGLLLSAPAGAVIAGGTRAQVVLDTGPSETGVKRIVVTYKGGGHANLSLAVANGATPTANTETSTLDAAPIATGSTTASFTFTTARRYAAIQLNTSGAFTGNDTSWLQIESVQVFRDTAYESSNASILKASTVATDAVSQVSGITARRIDATTAVIPHYLTTGSAEDAIAGAVRFETVDWGTWGPDSALDTSTNGYFDFKARDLSTAHWLARRSDCDDIALNVELATLYDSVAVEYRTVAGVRAVEVRTATVQALADAGISRQARLDGGTMTPAGAQVLGDAFLALSSQQPPARGSVSLSAPITHHQRGQLPPWHMRADGSNLRIPDVLPSKDALSLSAAPDRRTTFPIKRVEVDCSGQKPLVSASVDQTPDTLDQLVARLSLNAQLALG